MYKFVRIFADDTHQFMLEVNVELEMKSTREQMNDLFSFFLFTSKVDRFVSTNCVGFGCGSLMINIWRELRSVNDSEERRMYIDKRKIMKQY